MPTITWSNGKVDRARSWQKLLDRVRRDQWRDFDEDGFRYEMAKRAWLWSNFELDMGAPPVRFFEQLEKAHLIRIERSK